MLTKHKIANDENYSVFIFTMLISSCTGKEGRRSLMHCY